MHKDQLLAGQSTRQIIDYLVANQVAPPRGNTWHPRSVIDILRNPFYAGQVRWGASKVVKDRRRQQNKRDRKIPADQVKTGPGKHQPLWDLATHQNIVATIAGRTTNYLGRRNNQFTGLLRCGDCGAPLWRQSNGPRSLPGRLIWRCHAVSTAHITIPHYELLDLVATRLSETLRPYLERATRPQPSQPAQPSPDKLADLQRQRQRIADGYQAGLYTLDEAQHRTAQLDAQLQALRQSQETILLTSASRLRFLRQMLAQIDQLLPVLPAWLAENDPAETNAALHQLIDHITITTQPPAYAAAIHYLENQTGQEQ